LPVSSCRGCANIVGALLRKYDLGAVGNTIAATVGGGDPVPVVGADGDARGQTSR
jgi:hypothetical protein